MNRSKAKELFRYIHTYTEVHKKYTHARKHLYIYTHEHKFKMDRDLHYIQDNSNEVFPKLGLYLDWNRASIMMSSSLSGVLPKMEKFLFVIG